MPIIRWLEEFFEAIPLPILEVWGRFGYLLGLLLMFCAFSGFTFKPAGRWGFGWQRQRWDSKALLSMILTFILIFVTGYIGSSIVLVPGAQTFESLKDLSVFMCVVLFGYPALLIVPFAYGLSDLIEGVPPAFLLDWLLGYFINPACFWVAYQLIGKNPDFRKGRTWRWYALFVFIFMIIEPQLWGYLCSPQFTPAISYRSITPALFFTTILTWIMAPFAMLAGLPLARKLGFFWAEIPHHVREHAFKRPDIYWEAGSGRSPPLHHSIQEGLPIRMVLVTPYIFLVLLMIGTTAFLVLRSAEQTVNKLASHLHRDITDSIILRLNNFLDEPTVPDSPQKLRALLQQLSVAEQGRVFIVDQSNRTIATSWKDAPDTNNPAHSPTQGTQDLVEQNAIDKLREQIGKLAALDSPTQFRFDVLTPKPLSRETWLAQATPFHHQLRALNWIIVTSLPAAYYQEGVRTGNSQSAMILAVALALSLVIAALLSSIVTAPIGRLVRTTRALASGDLGQRSPSGRLEELNELSQSFNHMAAQLQEAFHRTRLSEEQFRDLVETTPGMVWQAEPHSLQFTFISQQAVSLLGYPVEECLEPGFWTLHLHPKDSQRVKEFYRDTLNSSDTRVIDYRFQRHDGKIIWLRDTVKVIRQHNNTRCLRGVMVDITERKQAEETLELSNMRSDTALQLTKAGHWHVPMDGSGWYNSSVRAVALFGDIPNASLRYRIMEDWYANVVAGDEDYAKKTLKNFNETMSGVIDVYDSTYAYKRPVDGKVVWIHALGKILKDDKGVATDMFGVTQDITEIKMAEDEIKRMNLHLEKRVAERTEKLIQTTKNLVDSSRKAGMAEVAIGVLHNIGNALTGASIKVQNLHMAYQEDDPLKHLTNVVNLLDSYGEGVGDFISKDEKGPRTLLYLKVISDELKKQHEAHLKLVTMLLKDLNNVSHLISKQQSNAKFTGTVENVQIHDCIEDVLALHAYDFDKYQVEIKKTYQQDLTLSTDRHKLLQIVSNLLSNALQAMTQNTSARCLVLKTFQQQDQVGVSVIDNGIGITKEQMLQMFRYGYTTKQSGHGFGLHSCSIDAKLLGGELSCHSEGTGLGSTFTLLLPVSPMPPVSVLDSDIS